MLDNHYLTTSKEERKPFYTKIEELTILEKYISSDETLGRVLEFGNLTEWQYFILNANTLVSSLPSLVSAPLDYNQRKYMKHYIPIEFYTREADLEKVIKYSNYMHNEKVKLFNQVAYAKESLKIYSEQHINYLRTHDKVKEIVSGFDANEDRHRRLLFEQDKQILAIYAYLESSIGKAEHEKFTSDLKEGRTEQQAPHPTKQSRKHTRKNKSIHSDIIGLCSDIIDEMPPLQKIKISDFENVVREKASEKGKEFNTTAFQTYVREFMPPERKFKRGEK